MDPSSAITFDIDWAPDWAVQLCASICRRACVPATFFATHKADVLTDLRSSPNEFELGMHPNFLPNSSHGGDPRSVIDYCVALVPEARSMRTHALVQSSPLLDQIADATAIEFELSLFLPLQTNLRPFTYHAGNSLRPLLRLPYFWEDDVAASWPGWRFDTLLPEAPGLRIYDFHPIHIALNTESMARYGRLKAHLGSRPLYSLSEAECRPYVNEGEGARRFLERLVSHGAPTAFARVSDLGNQHQRQGETCA